MGELVFTILNACFVLFCSITWVSGTTITSCAQTPYPEVCNYFIASNSSATQKYQTLSVLRDQSLLVTMNQAKQSYQAISAMDLSSFNPLAKLAWSDCLDLYEDTIYHLNQSVTSTNPIDVQTWLSASVANQQTCLNGFIDFNLESYLKSFQYSTLLSNFSYLLSNSLAINKEAIPTPSSNLYFSKTSRGGRRLLVDGFPSWVSASDRKLLQSSGPNADVVVAQDGSGNYNTISQALAASAGKSGNRFVIYVKKGVYKENVVIKRSMTHIMMVGDGIDATIVTGNRNGQESSTFSSATFAISGSGFIAKGMTFENTAGPQNSQAVALRSGSDFSVFYSCSFKGYQDTLYVYTMRQFYKNCDIYGTIDFIFGDAAVVLQSCNIYIRKPMGGQRNTVTAQGRRDPNENTGIVIHNSIVTATSDLKASQGSVKSYLGRPWHEYSRTVFMKSNIDGVIDPAGWLPWSGSFALNTLYYGEYMNSGAGASTSGRVKWPGYHVLSLAEAEKFTVGNFLAGNSWIPATGVPFDSGL